MTLQELREKLSELTGISGTNGTTILNHAIQLAAAEVWESADLPGSLQEVRICTSTNRFITLPWQVHKVRAAKAANERYSLEVNSVHPYYGDMRYYQNPLTFRLVRYVPIQNRITNASTLKFRAKDRSGLSADTTFTITGGTDQSSYVVEPLVLTAGVREVTSIERYVDIPLTITKNLRTNVDVDILDASGNTLATFPNHLLECKFMMVQMFDRCDSEYSTYSGCFDILFKPHPPQMSEDTDAFMDPFSQVVLFKSAEQITLRETDKIDVANAYNEKAAQLLKQFTADAVRGMTLKSNVKRDPLTTAYVGQI